MNPASPFSADEFKSQTYSGLLSRLLWEPTDTKPRQALLQARQGEEDFFQLCFSSSDSFGLHLSVCVGDTVFVSALSFPSEITVRRPGSCLAHQPGCLAHFQYQGSITGKGASAAFPASREELATLTCRKYNF